MPSSHLILCCLSLLLPSSFQASGFFPRSQFFASGGQSIGASVSALILPMNIQDWFPLGLTGLISLLSKGLQESSPVPQFKSINSSALSLLYGPTLTSINDYWKSHSFGYMIFVGKVMSLLFNMLSRFVIAFLPMDKSLLILLLPSLSTVILDPKKIISALLIAHDKKFTLYKGIWQILFSWTPKSQRTVIAAMKLKDTCSLEGKLWPS